MNTKSLRRVLIGLTPAVFIFYVACSGGSDPSTPPPAPTVPTDPNALAGIQAMQNAHQQFIQCVSSGFASVAQPVQSQIPAVVGQLLAQMQTSPQPYMSQPINVQSLVGGILANQPPPNPSTFGSCQQAFNNDWSNLSTIECVAGQASGTCYKDRPDVKQWWCGTLQSVGNNVASQLGLNPQAVAANPTLQQAVYPLAQAGMQQFTSQYPSITSQIQGYCGFPL